MIIIAVRIETVCSKPLGYFTMISLNPATTALGRGFILSPFGNEETEAQSGQVTGFLGYPLGKCGLQIHTLVFLIPETRVFTFALDALPGLQFHQT